jgi:hypothetical protein
MLRLILISTLFILSACGSAPQRQPAREKPSVDLTGHWEMDYSRSDNVNDKLQRMMREWQRAAEKRASMDRGRSGPAISMGGDSRSFNRIVASARLADMITESQVLDIEQSDVDIEVARESTFALTCVFSEGEPEVVLDDLGSEVCGWDGGDLLFIIHLPDSLAIRHRFTMAADGERLRVSTTVDSDSAPPFTMNRFYFKFNPLPEDYSCEYTLSRGNVCQRGPS